MQIGGNQSTNQTRHGHHSCKKKQAAKFKGLDRFELYLHFDLHKGDNNWSYLPAMNIFTKRGSSFGQKVSVRMLFYIMISDIFHYRPDLYKTYQYVT